MTEFLVKHFIKNHEDTGRPSVRTAYGMLSGIVGILCNFFLFVLKVTCGAILKSVSVTADGFNNLSDAGSSLIGIVGVRMAGKPADDEHPFGHGRIEYVAALIVSFIVIEVGLTFLKDSVRKTVRPQKLVFNAAVIVILTLSIGVKLWLIAFNRKLGKRVDSKVLLASAADSVSDVATTAATVISVLIYRLTGVNTDGIAGLLVSGFIIWAGIQIARDTLKPLLGEAVPVKTYEEITSFVQKYEGVLGTHDLLVHNYGPSRNMASLHVEVPNDADIEKSHELMDRIERDALKYLGVYLVIHTDPVETKDEETLAVKRRLKETIEDLDERAEIHDFRVTKKDGIFWLLFDLEVPADYDDEKRQGLCGEIRRKMREADERFCCNIRLRTNYLAMTDS